MALLLRVLTYCKQPPAMPLEQRFDYLGGTIGRNADNHFVLPDVSKFISRHHCRIEYSDLERCYTLTDLGSNASQVGGQPVGNGKTARLKQGDLINIGDYQLQVTVEEQAAAAPALDPFAYQATPSQYSQPAAASLLDNPPPGNSGSAWQDPLSGASILDVGPGSNADPLGFHSLGIGGDPLGSPFGGQSQPNAYQGSVSDHLPAQHMPYVAPNVMSRPAAPPPASGFPAGGGLIPDDFLAHPPAAAPIPAYTPPAPTGGAPVSLIPDDFDWLAPAPAAPVAPATPAWSAPVAQPAAAPILGAEFDPLGASPAAAPTLGANFDPLGAPLPTTAAPVAPLAKPPTPAAAPTMAPTLGADFDPLGGPPATAGNASAVAGGLAFDPLAPIGANPVAPGLLGSDFDPLGGSPATPGGNGAAVGSNSFDPLAPVARPPAAGHDDLDGTMLPAARPKPGVRSLPAGVAPAVAPVVQPPAQSTIQPISQPVGQPMSSPAPAVQAIAPTPVAPPAAPVAVAPVQAPVAAAAPGSSNREVMQALLRGLGVPELKIKGTDAELAELVGRMLRGAVAGTMGVLMARSATKREIRIEATMLAQKGNNPMKFFPDPEQAMSQMLTNAWAGYLPGEKAIDDAFDDLRAHELATIAGMRAALHGVLERFDPQAIEARLAVPTVMDKMLASNRKAKMWDQMVGLYKQMTSEADDDFQRLFGEKFAAAYEEQTNRLRLSRKL